MMASELRGLNAEDAKNRLEELEEEAVGRGQQRRERVLIDVNRSREERRAGAEREHAGADR